MSYVMQPQQAPNDPLTEVLTNLDPAQADALALMREIASNQGALAAAVVGLQRHAIDADGDLHELGESVAANTLPRLIPIVEEVEKLVNE